MKKLVLCASLIGCSVMQADFTRLQKGLGFLGAAIIPQVMKTKMISEYLGKHSTAYNFGTALLVTGTMWQGFCAWRESKQENVNNN